MKPLFLSLLLWLGLFALVLLPSEPLRAQIVLCDFICGNDIVEGAPDCEECDDGNTVDGDGCTSNCLLEFCGDGAVNNAGTEECDDGVLNSDTLPDACRTDCSFPSCGDGIVDTFEECDDGNNSDDDGCSSRCTFECGDGFVQAGVEECDDGSFNSDTEPDACREDCSFPSCGDDVQDTGEACDFGDDNSDTEPNLCRTDCTFFACGDEVVDAGEECDDGNNVDDDECSNDCEIVTTTTSAGTDTGSADEPIDVGVSDETGIQGQRGFACKLAADTSATAGSGAALWLLATAFVFLGSRRIFPR